MSKLPSVSVIIVNYNGKEYLTDCLNSLGQTEYPQFEIIVVDNNSTDGSQDVVKRFISYELRVTGLKRTGKRKTNSQPATRNPITIKLIENDKNLGFAKANNQAAKIAKGEKLVFLNSDTLVEKNWLRNLVEFSLKNPKYLVQPKILFWPQKEIIDNVGGIYRFPGFGFGRGRGQKDQSQFDQPSRVDYVNGTCFLIGKDFFWQLGGFDESFFLHYEDVDLCLRAKKHNGQCWTCPSSIIYHLGSATIKREKKKLRLAFWVKRNQKETIKKNFRGINRTIRIFLLLLIELILRFKGKFQK